MANERVLPNAVSNVTGSWTGAYTDIDEDVGGTYDGNIYYPTADGDECQVDFATPTGNPTSVTDDQQISICLTKILDGTSTEDGGGGDPLATITVYDGSSEVTLVTGLIITGLDQVNSYSFTYNGASDGSEVWVRVINTKGGGGPNERWLAIEAIEWNCEVGVATQTVTPAATLATFSTAAPTLVLGEVTLTLGAAAATFSVADPTLAIGEIVLTPDPVVITSSAVTPVVVKGEVTTLPDPVSAAWTTVAPTLQIGEVFANPTAVSATFSVPDPTIVTAADTTVTPDAVSAAFAVPDPILSNGIGTPIFRVTTYWFNGADFTGATYDLTLNNDLVDDYYVVFNQAGEGNNGGPHTSHARITQDPNGTGSLTASGAADQIRLERYNNNSDWHGSITITECLSDYAAGGFYLRDVVAVSITNTNTSNTGTSGTAWSDINQVGIYGGDLGGGSEYSGTGEADFDSSWARCYPSGTDTVNCVRSGSVSQLDVCNYVVEWGSEWTIQRVNVTGTNYGADMNATGEYSTAAINSVVRANTFLLWSGYTSNDEAGNGFCGTVVTLGDGVTENSSETTVAVSNHTDPGTRVVEVYVHTHADLAVDYRKESTGTGSSGTFAVDAATGAESYDEVSAVENTEGFRLPIMSAGVNSGTNYFQYRSTRALRLTGSTTASWFVGYAGSGAVGWIQVADLYGIGSFSGKMLFPASVVATLSAPDPVVTYDAGDVTVTPSAVSATFSTVVPTVTAGEVTLIPDPVVATFAVAVPVVVSGDTTLTPDPTTATFATAAPTLVLGEVTLTPDAATAAFSTAAPTLSIGTVTLTPDPVTATFATAAPTVTYGVVVTPSPVTATFTVAALTVLVGVVTLTPSPVVAAFNATLDAPTDEGIYIPTQYTSASRPAEFGTFIDELSGAIITRLTDAIGDSKLRIGPDYPPNAAINKNSTRMFLKVNGGEWWQYDIDGTYVRTLYSANDVRWSKLYNDIAYYCTGAQFRSFDATDGSTALIHTFSGACNLGGGSQDLSQNDRVAINDGGTVVRLYDIESDTVLGSETAAFASYDHITVASDGSGFIINWDANGASRYNGVEFYDDTATFARQLTQASAHGDMTLDASGDPFWCQVNQVATGDPSEPLGGKSIYKADLSTGTKTLIIDGIPTALSMHMSGRSCDGWLYPSYYDWLDSGLPGWYKFKNEIIRVKMDGSYDFERLCHHRSRGTSYYATPMAQPSPDGTMVVWHSDWMDTTLGDYHDTYIFSLIGDGPAPTLVLGPISVSPDPVAATFSTAVPTVVVGEVTLTPTPVVATFTAPDPVIVTSGLTTLTPSPVAATFSTAAVVIDVVVAPDPAIATFSTPVPVIQTSGSVTLTPSAVVATFSTAAPTLSLGAVTLTPSPVVATFFAPAPLVTTGLVLSPSPVAATFSVPAVIVDVVLAPSPVTATFSAAQPTLLAGLATLTPDPVTATFSAVVVSIGLAYTATPDPVIATFSVVSPSLSVGPLSVSPSPVTSTFSAPAPTVGIGEVTLTPTPLIATFSAPSVSIQMGGVVTFPTPVVVVFSIPAPLVEIGLITPVPVVIVSSVPEPKVFRPVVVGYDLRVNTHIGFTLRVNSNISVSLRG